MKRTITWLGIIFALVFCMTPARAAETSQTIAFSGCDGTLTGTVDLRFRLFTASDAGMMVFEETQTGIDASSTCFSVRIGDATAGGLPPAIFAGNPSLWIAFALDSDPSTELGGGRMPLTANGYAFRAANADNAGTFSAGATVAGTVNGPLLTLNNTGIAGAQGLSINAAQTGLVATSQAIGLDGVTSFGTGVRGKGFLGVEGRSEAFDGKGVYGVATSLTGRTYGVFGTSSSTSSGAAGVYGLGATGGNTFGVIGESPSGQGGRGVWGKATATSGDAIGVYGESSSSTADTAGVLGIVNSGTRNSGVRAISTAANGNGLIAEANNGTGAYAIWGKSTNGFAGFFDGKVQVNGNMAARVVQITGGSDFSEKFEVNEVKAKAQPGMVVAIDPDHPGQLVISTQAHNRRVAGIISGAGGVQPGMMMGQAGTLANGDHPVALSGRVYVWADASYGAIVAGDLLTTSNTPGHAMKVTNYNKAQGAILGKAMTGLSQGRGLVLVLVTLQ